MFHAPLALSAVGHTKGPLKHSNFETLEPPESSRSRVVMSCPVCKPTRGVTSKLPGIFSQPALWCGLEKTS